MKTNRRDFLKTAGITGVGVMAGGLPSCAGDGSPGSAPGAEREHKQMFNMSGYAAPPLKTVRVAVTGTGRRARTIIQSLCHVEGVRFTALNDVVPKEVEMTLGTIKKTSPVPQSPEIYASGNEDEWKKMCDREDIDLVVIGTPWHLHTSQAVYAMERGKHAATEVPAAQTIEECWNLVETSERTRKHCVQMTNVCFGFFEMQTLHMARQGLFGEIIHGDGAYVHHLIDQIMQFGYYHNMTRMRYRAERNGALYPLHGLGTIAQIMDINHGDQFDVMVSLSSDDFLMQARARELAKTNPFYEEFVNKKFIGTINTSIIRTKRGRTIMLQNDMLSPRPYDRIHQVSGTKAVARRYPEPMISIDPKKGRLSEKDARFKEIEEKYTPEITKRVGDLAKQIGGHGGMDTVMAWRIIDCLRNGIPMDLTVYEAAQWSSVIPSSVWSVAHGGMPVRIPDFTCGAWKTNKRRMDIQLEKGGTTRLI